MTQGGDKLRRRQVIDLVLAAARREDDAIAAMLHGSLAGALPTLQVGISAQPAAIYFAAVDEARSRFGAQAFDAIVAFLNLIVVTVMGAVVAGIYNLAVKVTGGLLVGFTSK